ncbi:hypothetical protein EPI10_027711 [Gossypium australe]|uniref:Uncharacterized protein n=1 Tax=Gossypium australe TaxID=47621 RepID=A0A5B6USN3_9ROSI|nr:hypothetical protein EPI10_027711 [Gossypium australe]
MQSLHRMVETNAMATCYLLHLQQTPLVEPSVESTDMCLFPLKAFYLLDKMTTPYISNPIRSQSMFALIVIPIYKNRRSNANSTDIGSELNPPKH